MCAPFVHLITRHNETCQDPCAGLKLKYCNTCDGLDEYVIFLSDCDLTSLGQIVCMYVCMYVGCICICMRMHLCSMFVSIHVCVYVCIHVYMYVCMYVCIYV